jgi:anti-sigma factor RsiW
MTEPPNSNPVNSAPNSPEDRPARDDRGRDARNHDAESHRGNGFDEALISGYLDGELTQSDRQRVALHLEDDASARRLYEQLREAREAALTTPFPAGPVDDSWDETPRSALSRVLLYLGLALLTVALLGGVSLWLLALGAHSSSLDGAVWIGLLPAAAALGTVSILVSVTIDRLISRRRDIYRLVKK